MRTLLPVLLAISLLAAQDVSGAESVRVSAWLNQETAESAGPSDRSLPRPPLSETLMHPIKRAFSASAPNSASTDGSATVGTSTSGDHAHSVSIPSTGAHTHSITINSGGAHTHSLTVEAAGQGAAVDNRPSTILLAFIMKS